MCMHPNLLDDSSYSVHTRIDRSMSSIHNCTPQKRFTPRTHVHSNARVVSIIVFVMWPRFKFLTDTNPNISRLFIWANIKHLSAKFHEFEFGMLEFILYQHLAAKHFMGLNSDCQNFIPQEHVSPKQVDKLLAQP